MLRGVLSLLLLILFLGNVNARVISALDIPKLEKKLTQTISVRDKFTVYLDLIECYNMVNFNKSKYYIDLALPLLDLPQLSNNDKTRFYLSRIEYYYNILDYKNVEAGFVHIKKICDPSKDLLQYIKILNLEVYYCQITNSLLDKFEMTMVESLVDSTKDLHSWLLFKYVEAIQYNLVYERFDDNNQSILDIIKRLEKAGVEEDFALIYTVAKGHANMTGKLEDINFINQKIQHYINKTGNINALYSNYLQEIKYLLQNKKIKEANNTIILAHELDNKLHSPRFKLYSSLFSLSLYQETKDYSKLIEESLKLIDATESIQRKKYFFETNFYAKIMLVRSHAALGDDLEQYWFNQVNQDLNIISNNFKSSLFKAHSDWYFNRQNIDSALIYIEKAFKYRGFASHSLRMEIMVAYAEIISIKGRYEEANDIYKKCLLQLNNSKLNNETTIKVYLSLARLLIQKDKDKHQKQIYKYIYTASSNIDQQAPNLSQAIFYREVASLYEQLGDIKESLLFLDKSSNINDQSKMKVDISKIYDLEKKYLDKWNKPKIEKFENKFQDRMIFALCLAIMLTIISIYFIKDFFNRKNQKLKLLYQNLIQENNDHLVREKQRIKRDLHDEVGSNLTSISLKAKNFSKKLDKNNEKTGVDEIAKLAYYASRNLSDLVWSLETENCYHDHIIQRIILTSSSIVEEAGVDFYTQYPKIISSTPLDPISVKLILQSFKEVFLSCIQSLKLISITFIPESYDSQFVGKIAIEGFSYIEDDTVNQLIQQSIDHLPSSNQEKGLLSFHREWNNKIILELIFKVGSKN